MASPRSRVVKQVVPGKLSELSKNFTMVLRVEKPPDLREFKDKVGSGSTKYCVIVGIGEDGLRQDCVFFGEAYEHLPEIAVGA